MAGKLRKMFTNKEIELAISSTVDNDAAARWLTSLGRGFISRQLVRYWARHLKKKKLNGEPYIGTTVLDRAIRKDMTLRVPSPADDTAKVSPIGYRNDRVLVLTDPHAPYHHRDFIPFLAALKKEFNFTNVYCAGDEVDGHALGFHDSDPNLDSAGPELSKARVFISQLHDLFPVMKIAHSNHGSLVYRRATKAGIPCECIKPYREILFPDGGGEGWAWEAQIRFTLPNGDDCQIEHETSGTPLSVAAHERCNYIQGHRHSQSTISYSASKAALYWACIIGCALDKESKAFEYGKTIRNRPILAVLLIIDSIPVLMPMYLNQHGRWIGTIPNLRCTDV